MDFRTNLLDEWVKNKMDIHPSQLLSPKMIKDYQLRKLTEVLAYVSKYSPFYQRHLKGYQINNIKNLKDVTSLPFTTEEDLRNFGLQMLCVSQSKIKRVVTLATSGTTGNPKRVFFTPADQELTIDYFKQGMNTFTLSKEKVLILLPGETPGSIGNLLASALKNLGLQPIKFDINNTLGDILNKLVDTQADVVVGIPIHLLALAKYYELTAEKPPLSLKRILLSTDYVAQTIIAEIKRVWDCEVFRYFGMTEMGLGGGIECRKHNGYHLYEGDFLFEIVDSDSGTVLPEGEYGEVVFTTLTRRGMPLVRYRTGDIARFIPEKCPCGSVLSRLDYIKARRTGIVNVAEIGSFTIGDLDEILLALPGVIDFTGVISFLSGFFILKLKVITLEKSLSFSQIYEALQVHPVFCFLLKQDRLRLSVKEIIDPTLYLPQMGKRRIVIEDTDFLGRE
ncbi:MAG: DVU_1553 family AMP-dependent CoA ligase [Peptococcales bacterium]|jgi:phenylacetate-CoA ligase